MNDDQRLVTRRDRRRQRKSRGLEARVGWLGYGLSVLLVMSMAAWLAVRPDHRSLPPRTAEVEVEDTVVTRGVEPVSVPAPQAEAVPAPVVPVSASPTTADAPSTTTTTAPVVAAAGVPASTSIP